LARPEPARTGTQAGDGEPGRVVDEQGQLCQSLRRKGKLLEVLAADLAHAQGFGADAGLLGQDARGELVGAHFEAEERGCGAYRFFDRNAVGQIALKPVRRVEGDVGDE